MLGREKRSEENCDLSVTGLENVFSESSVLSGREKRSEEKW